MASVTDRLGRYEGDPWNQQPDESALQHSRFLEFAAMPPKDRRTGLSEIARNHGVDPSTIWEAAERWRWRERAALWDGDKHKARRDTIAEKELDLAERAMNLALVSASIMARTLRTIADTNAGIEPKDLPAWAKMVETLRKVAIDAPDQLVALTGPGGGPIQIEEFDGLSADQVRDRAGEMARSVLRVLHGGRAS